MDTAIPGAWRQLTAVERDILVVLADGDGRMIREISDRVGDSVSDAAVGRNVATLRAAGYVESERDADDERRKVTTLTDDGRAVVRAGAEAVGERVARGGGDG